MNNISITIHTVYGTFIVPMEKINDLVMWLERNAIKITESTPTQVANKENTISGKQLINE